MELSPQKIKTFETCRQKYYFEYLDPEIAKIKKQLKKKRPEMEMGSFVHDALTLFFKEPFVNRSWQKMAEILKNVWQGPRGKGYGFKTIEEERTYYQLALRMLFDFVKTENLNPNIFALPISPPGRSYDDYVKVPFVNGIEIGGKIDRVDINQNQELEIIDYKTGNLSDNFIQLMSYVFLAEGSYKKPVVKTANIYLKSKQRQELLPDENARQKAKNKILAAAGDIDKEIIWPPNVSKLCLWCDYVDFCPKKQEILEKFGKENFDLNNGRLL